MGLEHTGLHLCCHGALALYFATSEFAEGLRSARSKYKLVTNLHNTVRQATAFLEPVCELTNISRGLSLSSCIGYTGLVLDAVGSSCALLYIFSVCGKLQSWKDLSGT